MSNYMFPVNKQYELQFPTHDVRCLLGRTACFAWWALIWRMHP